MAVKSDIRNKRMEPKENKKPIRILLSGFGLIGAQHAKMVYEREGCER